MNGARNGTIFICPAPWGPGEARQKDKYHKISITKSISNIFKLHIQIVLNKWNEHPKLFFRFEGGGGGGKIDILNSPRAPLQLSVYKENSSI